MALQRCLAAYAAVPVMVHPGKVVRPTAEPVSVPGNKLYGDVALSPLSVNYEARIPLRWWRHGPLSRSMALRPPRAGLADGHSPTPSPVSCGVHSLHALWLLMLLLMLLALCQHR